MAKNPGNTLRGTDERTIRAQIQRQRDALREFKVKFEVIAYCYDCQD